MELLGSSGVVPCLAEYTAPDDVTNIDTNYARIAALFDAYEEANGIGESFWI